jgi:ArsR family transcriptional regulator
MSDIPSLMAALSEPIRLMALRLVWDGQEHCVCEFMKKLGATQSRMSPRQARL